MIVNQRAFGLSMVRRVALATALVAPLAAAADPAHTDRTKPPNCIDAVVVEDMRRILVHAFQPQHIDVLDVLHTEDGIYEGAQVCTGLVITTKRAVHVVFFGQRVEGRVYGRVLTVPTPK